MKTWHKQAIDVEIAALLSHGYERVSVAEFKRRYDIAGFRFDPRDSIRQFSRYISGPRAGQISPIVSMEPIVKTTGRGYTHDDNPPDVYAKVKAMRSAFFAVSHDGYILEV